jgi:asparagine synthase (glutamine-hydrolysing)
MVRPLLHLKQYQTKTHCCNNIGVGVVAFPDGWGFEIWDDVCVVYFGDIYRIENSDIISSQNKRSSGKKIITSYKKYGERLPEKLNGNFNIFVYDISRDISYIFNDRFGFRHLYLYHDDNIFMFSPEIKALYQYEDLIKTTNSHGISDFFVYFYHLGNRTFFKNIKLLPPATILKIKGAKISMKTYWSPVYSNKKRSLRINDTAEQGFHLFEQSVKRCVVQNKKTLVPLSGGLDSRLILAVAKGLSSDITTITFGNSKCMDYKLAGRVCDVLGMERPVLVQIEPNWLKNYAKDLVHLGECSYGALGMTTQHGIAQRLKNSYEISLNGIFGGHLSFGSPYYTQHDIESDYSTTDRIERIKRGFNGHRYQLFKNCLSGNVQQMIDAHANDTIIQEWERSKSVSDKYPFRQDYIFIYNRIRRGMNYINQNSFFYNDQQPFASYELFDFYLSLSPEIVSNHFLYKEIYKRKLPALARIPWQQTGLNLYTESSRLLNLKQSAKRKFNWYLSRATKGRFVLFDYNQYENHDIAYLKNTSIQKWVEAILLSDRCLERGYYSKKGILSLLNKEKNGLTLFFEIGKLVMFELWAREFLDESVNSHGE